MVSTKIVFTTDRVKKDDFHNKRGPREGVKGNRVKMKGPRGGNERYKKWSGVNKDCFHNRRGQSGWFSQQTGSKRIAFITDGVIKHGFHHRRGPKGRFQTQQGQHGRYRG